VSGREAARSGECAQQFSKAQVEFRVGFVCPLETTANFEKKEQLTGLRCRLGWRVGPRNALDGGGVQTPTQEEAILLGINGEA